MDVLKKLKKNLYKGKFVYQLTLKLHNFILSIFLNHVTKNDSVVKFFYLSLSLFIDLFTEFSNQV